MITFAPEIKNNLDMAIKYKFDFFWSIGHSLANKKIIDKCLAFNFNRITHLCNGMNDLNHKYNEESIVNYALTKNIYSEIITDSYHVNKTTLKIIHNSIKKENIFIVSDSLSPKGLKNGIYKLNKIKINKKNNLCFVNKTKTLAGSASKYSFLFKKMLNITHNMNSLVFYSSINANNYFHMNNSAFLKNQVASFILINKKGDIKAIYEHGKRIK